jgi:hypothetical protein
VAFKYQLKREKDIFVASTYEEYICRFLQTSPKIQRHEIDGVYDVILKTMNATLAELTTMVEKERIAEEQERLHKIQVGAVNGTGI